ncbi:uncharacterized protein LOC119689291 [Teleopsis dalmanni]|uniref:uncharacterized protein LOC119689291 n=1 Tax=Teleopsis dalmanni TaxID=139649 RepID=UPI0018CD083C|nr:uncharacterized protein LOC119689291 [Teleopsis dalmanni]
MKLSKAREGKLGRTSVEVEETKKMEDFQKVFSAKQQSRTNGPSQSVLHPKNINQPESAELDMQSLVSGGIDTNKSNDIFEQEPQSKNSATQLVSSSSRNKLGSIRSRILLYSKLGSSQTNIPKEKPNPVIKAGSTKLEQLGGYNEICDATTENEKKVQSKTELKRTVTFEMVGVKKSKSTDSVKSSIPSSVPGRSIENHTNSQKFKPIIPPKSVRNQKTTVLSANTTDTTCMSRKSKVVNNTVKKVIRKNLLNVGSAITERISSGNGNSKDAEVAVNSQLKKSHMGTSQSRAEAGKKYVNSRTIQTERKGTNKIVDKWSKIKKSGSTKSIQESTLSKASEETVNSVISTKSDATFTIVRLTSSEEECDISPNNKVNGVLTPDLTEIHELEDANTHNLKSEINKPYVILPKIDDEIKPKPQVKGSLVVRTTRVQQNRTYNVGRNGEEKVTSKTSKNVLEMPNRLHKEANARSSISNMASTSPRDDNTARRSHANSTEKTVKDVVPVNLNEDNSTCIKNNTKHTKTKYPVMKTVEHVSKPKPVGTASKVVLGPKLNTVQANASKIQVSKPNPKTVKTIAATESRTDNTRERNLYTQRSARPGMKNVESSNSKSSVHAMTARGPIRTTNNLHPQPKTSLTKQPATLYNRRSLKPMSLAKGDSSIVDAKQTGNTEKDLNNASGSKAKKTKEAVPKIPPSTMKTSQYPRNMHNLSNTRKTLYIPGKPNAVKNSKSVDQPKPLNKIKADLTKHQKKDCLLPAPFYHKICRPDTVIIANTDANRLLDIDTLLEYEACSIENAKNNMEQSENSDKHSDKVVSENNVKDTCTLQANNELKEKRLITPSVCPTKMLNFRNNLSQTTNAPAKITPNINDTTQPQTAQKILSDAIKTDGNETTNAVLDETASNSKESKPDLSTKTFEINPAKDVKIETALVEEEKPYAIVSEKVYLKYTKFLEDNKYDLSRTPSVQSLGDIEKIVHSKYSTEQLYNSDLHNSNHEICAPIKDELEKEILQTETEKDDKKFSTLSSVSEACGKSKTSEECVKKRTVGAKIPNTTLVTKAKLLKESIQSANPKEVKEKSSSVKKPVNNRTDYYMSRKRLATGLSAQKPAMQKTTK